MQIMLSAGLEIDDCKPISPRGKEGTHDYMTGSLCIAIKDHNSNYAKRLSGESSQQFASLYVRAVSGVMVAPEELHKSPEFGIHPVRITLTRQCSQAFMESIKGALDNIKYTGLQYDLVEMNDMQPSSQSSSSLNLPERATSKICVAIDGVRRAMEKLSCKLRGGHVYRKVPQGKYTFVKSCSVHQFLHSLLRNSQLAELIAPNMAAISGILSYRG